VLSDFVVTLLRHRSLVFELTKREFTGRYRGSFGGVLWSIAQPLFLLSVYTVAFGVILKARWGGARDTADYAFMLFAGLIVFNVFSEVSSRATTLVSGSPNFVKKVVFPLELLVIVTVATAFIHALIGLAVWLLGYAIVFGVPKTTSLLVPLVFLAFLPVVLGLGWLLSAIGVIVKDVHQFTSMVTHTLLFLTPIFYSIESAPPLLQNLLMLNPLAFIVEQLRLVLFYGHPPSLQGLALYFAVACFFAWASLILFKRLRPSFADLV
jgi:lipopolysaccharide transport system permease protein